jgi:hypothetical protein
MPSSFYRRSKEEKVRVGGRRLVAEVGEKK